MLSPGNSVLRQVSILDNRMFMQSHARNMINTSLNSLMLLYYITQFAHRGYDFRRVYCSILRFLWYTVLAGLSGICDTKLCYYFKFSRINFRKATNWIARRVIRMCITSHAKSRDFVHYIIALHNRGNVDGGNASISVARRHIGRLGRN